MDYFKDKIAIVTGGASGIGRALCRELSRNGSVVVVTDINSEGAEKVASEISTGGGRASAASLDVCQAEDVQQIIDDVVSEHGRLDFMFNNAGIAIAGETRDTTIDHWRRVLDVDLHGVVYGTTAAYQVMVKQGFGHIVNTASLVGLGPLPGGASYCAAKHAVVGLSTTLRLEAADLGVKVSVICPGAIDTEIFQASTYIRLNRDELLGNLPLKAMDVNRFAKRALKGVARNREYIVIPFTARFIWWLLRLYPGMLSPWGRHICRDLRKYRTES